MTAWTRPVIEFFQTVTQTITVTDRQTEHSDWHSDYDGNSNVLSRRKIPGTGNQNEKKETEVTELSNKLTKMLLHFEIHGNAVTEHANDKYLLNNSVSRVQILWTK